jgi:uncharacterized protein involved in cysteine biosynthesis
MAEIQPPGFFSGMLYPFRGLRHLAGHRDLWRYVAAAFGVTLLVFLLLSGLFIAFALAPIVDALTPANTPSWAVGATRGVLSLAVGFAALFLFAIIGRLAAAPCLDAMTERMLTQLGETLPPSRGPWRGLPRMAANQAIKLLLFGALQATLLLLIVTPLGFLHPPLSALLSILLLAFEGLDCPLDARGIPVSGRFAYVFRHLRPALGFGATAFLVLLVPCLGFLTLPIWICGGILLAHELDGEK